jgi:signal transduction histidine kinase
MKRVNIHEGLDSTLLILQHRLREKPGRPTIQVIKEYATLPLVECYAGQLNQVFTNILANAIDALESHTVSSEQVESEILTPPSSPCIQICTEIVDSLESDQDSKSVVIRIRDNGPGMTESVRLRCLTPSLRQNLLVRVQVLDCRLAIKL